MYQTDPKFAFGYKLKIWLNLLFSLFLLLFMCLIIFFNIIYKFYCAILVNFYFYLVKKNYLYL